MSLLLKSYLSLFMLFQVLLALYSKLEIMGCEKGRVNPPRWRRIHRINGYIFIILFLVISYYCLFFLRAIPGEPSARALLHSLFAIGVISMLALKIFFVGRYKKFMRMVPAFGLTVFFLTLGMIATSGGYYFVTRAESPPDSQATAGKQTAPSYQANIEKGRQLFNKWCVACHDPASKQNRMGPGLKGILKAEKLPVSQRAATVDNIRRQLRTPYRLMPPQTHLGDEEVNHIIEFLKTI